MIARKDDKQETHLNEHEEILVKTRIEQTNTRIHDINNKGVFKSSRDTTIRQAQRHDFQQFSNHSQKLKMKKPTSFAQPKQKKNIKRGAFDSAKKHQRQRRKRQSVTAKRKKSQTPKFV